MNEPQDVATVALLFPQSRGLGGGGWGQTVALVLPLGLTFDLSGHAGITHKYLLTQQSKCSARLKREKSVKQTRCSV